MVSARLLQKPSAAVRLIKTLPRKEFALRLWNRIVRLRPELTVETIFGSKIVCRPIDIIQATIIHFGVWEPEITSLVKRLVSSGDTAIDLGANVGYYSLLFSKLGARVIAIEAHPVICDELSANCQLNGENVRVICCAVTEEAGDVELFEAPATNIGMSTLEPGKFPRSRVVKGSTLMEILESETLDRVTLIKIDIEGSEGPPMREILSNLPRFSADLAICVEAASDWKETFDGFLAAGYRAFLIQNDLLTLWRRLLNDELEPELKEVFSFPSGLCDLLLIRGDRLNARLYG